MINANSHIVNKSLIFQRRLGKKFTKMVWRKKSAWEWFCEISILWALNRALISTKTELGHVSMKNSVKLLTWIYVKQEFLLLIWVKCDPKYRHFIKSREKSWNHVKIPEIMWNFVNLQEIALAFSSELWFDFNAIGSELGQVSIKNFVKLHEFTKNHGRTGNGGEIMKITGNFGKSRKR